MSFALLGISIKKFFGTGDAFPATKFERCTTNEKLSIDGKTPGCCERN